MEKWFYRNSKVVDYLNQVIFELIDIHKNNFSKREFIELTLNYYDSHKSQAIELLEFNLYTDDFYGIKDICLKFCDVDWQITDVNYFVENLIDESFVEEYFPELNVSELTAAFRVVTIFLNRFHCDARGKYIRDEYFLSELNDLSKQVLETNTLIFDKEKFNKSFFLDSSHTDGNINAMENIVYGSIENDNSRYGLKIRTKDFFLSDIILRLESCPKAYDFLEKELAGLSKEKYQTALEIISVLLRGYECCKTR